VCHIWEKRMTAHMSFNSAEPWSVEQDELAFDDARKVDGVCGAVTRQRKQILQALSRSRFVKNIRERSIAAAAD
jgi:hypothetical protein